MRAYLLAAAYGCLLSNTVAFATSKLPMLRVDTAPGPSAMVDELQYMSLAENPLGFEGEASVLTLGTPEASASQAVFSMTGLPAEFIIDEATGEISGVFGPRDAGQHLVTVHARSESRTERLTFTWIVLDKTLPRIAGPGLQVSRAGDVLQLQLEAVDEDGDDLTFATYGLPRGLELDGATGLISGTVAAHELRTTYTVTVVAKDGNVSGGTVFTWVILPSAMIR